MTDRMTLAEYRKVAGKSSVSSSGRVVAVASPTSTKHVLVQTAKRSKFGNVRTTVDGIVFDSKREALHWQLLVMQAAAGKITELKRQVRYDLHVCGVKVCAYIADFVNFDGDQWIVADSKGRKTPMYELKKKMMFAEYGIEILEM